MRHGKYNARQTTVKGIRFASAAEAARYLELVLLERAGEIHGLRVQPRYPLLVNGMKVGTYVGDAEYHEKWNGQWVKIVEDTKSPATITPLYRLKARLMLACYGITIREVMRGKARPNGTARQPPPRTQTATHSRPVSVV